MDHHGQKIAKLLYVLSCRCRTTEEDNSSAFGALPESFVNYAAWGYNISGTEQADAFSNQPKLIDKKVQ